MSRIDLNTNREELLRAHKEISDHKKANNWVVFGYEGKTSTLKFVEKGDGGVEEMTDELNSGKIMYAYLRVKDPNTDLQKFVLINWQGEGVPEMIKGTSANHFRDVQALFRGAHVTINARTEDDIEEDAILKLVAKSSGSNYSYHKEKPQNIPEPSGLVGSVYKKTLPHAEINPSARDKFWEKTEQEERKRQAEDSKQSQLRKEKLEKERIDREKQEAEEREKLELQRNRKIREIKAAERRASETDESTSSRINTEDVQKDALRDEDERRKRSEHLRKQRQAEAASLVSMRDANPRGVFELQPESQFDKPKKAPPPPRKLKYSFKEENPEQPQKRKQPIELPHKEAVFDRPTPAGHISPEAEQEEEAWEEPEPEPERPAPSKPIGPPSPEPEHEAAPSRPVGPPPRLPQHAQTPTSPTSPTAMPTTELPKTRNLLAEALPQRRTSDSEPEEEDDWGEEAGDAKIQPVMAAPSPPNEEPEEADEVHRDEELPGTTTDQEGTIHLEMGMCARALYDYQAADDTEITFDPDDIISNIEQIDEGWWTGVAPDGKHGMFPANYVEIIN